MFTFDYFCLTLFTLFIRWPSTAQSSKDRFHSNKPGALRWASAGLHRRAVPHRRKGRAWRRCHETTNRIPASQPSPEDEQARLDKVARNQQLLAGMSMPQIRGEESAQPRAARTPRCEPLRRGRLHPVVTQLCRRIRNADLAPTRRSARHRATALTPRHSAALVCSSLFSTPCARQGAR